MPQQTQYAQNLKDWIPERIKTLRKEYGWTQAEMAGKAGLPQTRITDAEAGNWGHTIASLAKLLVALDISPSHFFTGAPRP
jgi:transcriptional regulator with XRE-family HTH domain